MLSNLITKTRSLATAVLLALFLASMTVGSVLGQQTAPSDTDTFRSYDLTGTWSLTITPDDGSPSFAGFYSFAGDGNASFSSAGPPIPGLGNPGYGVWKRQGRNQFTSVIKMISYTPDFQFDGTLKIRANIVMTGRNSFVTTDTVTIYAPDGTQVAVFGGNAHGTRITVDDEK